MPLFDLKCTECGHEFEVFRKYSSITEDVCEKCGGPVEKLVSASNFQLQGSGWAKDNYGGVSG